MGGDLEALLLCLMSVDAVKITFCYFIENLFMGEQQKAIFGCKLT